ncbi:ABC transporter ATP-binding protein [Marivita hallyeonensis]|uniref:Capsular polysaccharide transport system ATP-binding protein n=1 Tax=Marivita hallyeonensis TaxID=996342 RepID=A0A1M5Y6E9_9RHOB|nr:ATP-binding cassette domain-containing protein [Marivita hallyeonensis]SHI07542.1 capsular polysaccharide transport system ATP-binding protein [Marivita hallyeonensis]
MIVLQDVWKRFPGGAPVAQGVSAVFPRGRATALLGANGAGKSSLLAMIAGTLRPDAGRVVRQGTVSWPVGFAGAFHPDLTGAQNTRFVARVYGVDSGALLSFVRDVSGLDRAMGQPVRRYSSGMRARLGFALSMGIPFDMYLVDEVTAVGDAAFRRETSALLRARLGQAGAVVVSHAPAQLREICTAGAVLREGRLEMFDDLDVALAVYQAGVSPASTPPATGRAGRGAIGGRR